MTPFHKYPYFIILGGGYLIIDDTIKCSQPIIFPQLWQNWWNFNQNPPIGMPVILTKVFTSQPQRKSSTEYSNSISFKNYATFKTLQLSVSLMECKENIFTACTPTFFTEKTASFIATLDLLKHHSQTFPVRWFAPWCTLASTTGHAVCINDI